jgi:hypothetical protein
MADGVLVVLLLVCIWAAVLLLPAAGARASREAQFLGSIRPDGHPHDNGSDSGQFATVDQPRLRPALSANARRRQVLGGLTIALGATLLLGLLPTFRLLLVVHLFLVNSCLAYVGLLVHLRDQRAVPAHAASSAGWRQAGAVPVADGAELGRYLAPEELEDGDEVAYLEGAAEPDERELAYLAATAGEASAPHEEGSDEDAWDEDAWDEYTEYEGTGYEGTGYEDDEAEAAWVDEDLGLRRAV